MRAARTAGMPVAISFTVETDGRLPGGIPLARAITDIDDAARPDYFMVNCAHPAHIVPALAEPGGWRERIAGLRYHASVKSHAELDQTTDLDDGNPNLLAAAHAQLVPLLPRLSVVGGAAVPMPVTSPPYGARTTKPACESRHRDRCGSARRARDRRREPAGPVRSCLVAGCALWLAS